MKQLPSRLQTILQTEIDPAFSKRAHYIFAEIQKHKSACILDAGCGRGFYSHTIALFPFVKRIYGIDINEKYLQVAKTHCTNKKIKLIKSSIYSLPFPSNYFDCIVLSEVLEHLTDERKTLIELRRVLKKGGIILLTVPNANYPFLWDPLNWILERTMQKHISSNIWWLSGIWADHERLYSQESIQSLLKKHRFTVQFIKTLVHWCWPFSHFFLYGIGKNIVEKMKINSVNRFNFSRKTSFFSQLIAILFKLPTRLLDKKIPLRSSVNIVALVVK